MGEVRGRTSYKLPDSRDTLTSQQNDHMFLAFRDLLTATRPARILEIGTAGGGTIAYIRDILNELNLTTSKILSLEVKEHKWYPTLRERGIEVVIENIFDKSYRNLEKPEMVESFIKDEGTTIILCDGGSKANEFRLLSQFLKTGDIIMAHDFIDTRENFIENYREKIWNWREIGDEHINPVCDKYGLEPFMQETFNLAVWACRRKV